MSWKDELSEELRNAPALKDIPTVEALAKSMVDTQRHLGNTVSLPKDDWGADEVKAWDAKIIEKAGGRLVPAPTGADPDALDTHFKALGLPDSPDKYTTPEGLDTSVFSDTELSGIRNRLHKGKLTDAQQQELLKTLAEEKATDNSAAAANKAARDDRLKVEWGEHAEYKQRELAEKLRASGAPQEVVTMVSDGTLDASSTLFLAKTMTQLKGEGNPLSGDPPGPGFRTPGDVRRDLETTSQRITDLMSITPQTPAIKQQVTDIVAKQLKLREELATL